MKPTLELEASKPQLKWLCNECFPLMLKMSAARTNIYNPGEVEYINAVIVGYVLERVVAKFEQKRQSAKLHLKINMEPAEVCTLYRFLFNFPIKDNDHWRLQTRQFLIDQLHKLMQVRNTKIHEDFFSQPKF